MTEKRSIRLAGKTLEHSPHVCAFFNTREMDILCVHPGVIIGGILHQNPFYTPPQDFLQELHRRLNPSARL
jgi:hypothetical protein